MDFKPENGFEQIKVSDKLDDVVEKAINKAKKDRKKRNLKTKFIKYSMAAASIAIICISSIKYIPVFAQAVSNVTMGPAINRELQFHYDKNIGTAVKEGVSQHVNESKIDENIKVTINNIVGDDKKLFIFYTLNGKMNKEGLKNLLLQNFKISDDEDNTLLNSTSNYYSKLPPMLNNEEGEFLLTFNKRYRCIVTSLGNNIKNYGQNQETYGCIELSTYGGSKIPNELNLKLLSFTEVYKMSYSKEKYEDFLSEFKRNPMSINGDWNFHLYIGKRLKYEKPETYSNIKFHTNYTDFDIKSFKIYPTRIETRIELGNNKVDSLQCYSIGSVSTKNGKINNNKLPYLIDEKGNKYILSDDEISELDSDKCLNLTFESCYFNHSKELYLVINQLNYNDGSENSVQNIDEMKIRIK